MHEPISIVTSTIPKDGVICTRAIAVRNKNCNQREASTRLNCLALTAPYTVFIFSHEKVFVEVSNIIFVFILRTKSSVVIGDYYHDRQNDDYELPFSSRRKVQYKGCDEYRKIWNTVHEWVSCNTRQSIINDFNERNWSVFLGTDSIYFRMWDRKSVV